MDFVFSLDLTKLYTSEKSDIEEEFKKRIEEKIACRLESQKRQKTGL